MPKKRRRTRKQPGLPPGSVVFTGERPDHGPKMTLFLYDDRGCHEQEVRSLAELAEIRARGGVLWLNIEGLHDAQLLSEIGLEFNIHPLALEDIANTEQRPKVHDYDHNLFICLKMVRPERPGGACQREQVSLVLARDYLISFQEGLAGDVFEPIRTRLRGGRGKLRGGLADFLAYALIDVIVDHYFVALEQIGERYEELEELVLKNPASGVLPTLVDARKEIGQLRKDAWPLREVCQSLLRDEPAFFNPTTLLHVRDVYDHSVELLERVEMLRETINTTLELYMSSVSNQTNEVMRVLAVISTIFMPLSFIAGVYGMNFEHMPELHWVYGYPLALGVMLFVAAAFVVYFRRRGWL